MKMIRIICLFQAAFLFSLLFIGPNASACRIIPVEKNKSKYLFNLIKGSTEIYWAEAVSVSDQDETVTFKVIEVIRGEKKDQVVFEGKTASGNENELKKLKNDYNSHRDPKFWEASFEGRTQFNTMCRLSPQFTVGERYLLLDKKPYQPKSFEIVRSTKDQWYQHVRNTIYPPKKKKSSDSVSGTTVTTTQPASSAPDAQSGGAPSENKSGGTESSNP